jgi:hypothetical protein
MDESPKSPADDEQVEALARELAERLRSMPNRTELTDYAVSLLRESNEEADQAEQARTSVSAAHKGDAFNPIAFGIPLLIVGFVLVATGILAGPGLGIIGVAILMVIYGFLVAVFSRGKPTEKRDAS